MDDWNPMVPELLVADAARSVVFYVDVLGFSVRYMRDDPPFAYLELDGAQLMLQQEHPTAWVTGDLVAPRGRGINLQVEVPDVGAVRERVVAAGHALFRDLADHAYAVDDGVERQRELLVQDPDGYLLRLVQVLP